MLRVKEKVKTKDTKYIREVDYITEGVYCVYALCEAVWINCTVV